MNILIIGNGFDLAHDFPTRYKDFLKFINEVKEYCEKFIGKCVSDDDKKGKDYFDFLIDLDEKDDFEYINNVFELSNNNLWVKYFNTVFKDNSYLGDTWIDFENEIAKAINYISSNNINKKNPSSKNIPFEVDLNLFYFINAINKNSIFTESTKAIEGKIYLTQNIYFNNYTDLKKELLSDLKDFIRCLEIYICIHINKINPNKRITELDDIDSIDAVLSFNYSNTYERLYGNDNADIKYHYIHGKANIDNTVSSCQLVLGINEYSDTSDDKDTEFIQYEKFFQRIYKRNGCEYTKWIENKSGEYNIYIYGHSLDSTDADVLNEFIELENCQITIFYYNDEALESQITNLTKIIGRKKMIEFTSGSSPKIIFKRQDNASEIMNDETLDVLEPLYVQLNMVRENFKRLGDVINNHVVKSALARANNPALKMAAQVDNSALKIAATRANNSALKMAATQVDNSALKMAAAQVDNSALKMAAAQVDNSALKMAAAQANNPAVARLNSPAVQGALARFNNPAVQSIKDVEKNSNNITQAAHNEHLDEPDEPENIQEDLDEMDNWNNEE